MAPVTVKNKETKTRLLSEGQYFGALPTETEIEKGCVRERPSVPDYGTGSVNYAVVLDYRVERGIIVTSEHRSESFTRRRPNEARSEERAAVCSFCWIARLFGRCTFKDVSLIYSQMPGDAAAVALHTDHRRAGNG